MVIWRFSQDGVEGVMVRAINICIERSCLLRNAFSRQRRM